jgi:hypothetical protein
MSGDGGMEGGGSAGVSQRQRERKIENRGEQRGVACVNHTLGPHTHTHTSTSGDGRGPSVYLFRAAIIAFSKMSRILDIPDGMSSWTAFTTTVIENSRCSELEFLLEFWLLYEHDM